MDKNIDVLLVDDDDIDAKLAICALREPGQNHFRVTHVRSLTNATHALQAQVFDVILLDLGLPETSGYESFAGLSRFANGTPIVALSGLEDQKTALQLVDEGAQDYILKNEVKSSTLPRLLLHAIQRHQLVEELRIANQQLVQKNERLAELYATAQRFVDNVSHEFRTPLTVIREFSAIVLDGLDGPVNSAQQKRLSSVINRTDDLSLMVDDLLDISRLESGMLSTWRRTENLDDCLQHTLRTVQRRAANRSIDVKVYCPENLPTVFIDEEKLRRVVTNLAINAIKFTPENGQVKITASAVDDQYVRISVSDNGPGIDPEELQVIFERFQQAGAQKIGTSCKGFGLGLNIAQELVGLNLGKMDVESTLGEGSTFSFTVPIADPQTLVECYIEKHKSETTYMTGMLVALDANEDSSSFPVLDEFLHHSFRNHDFVFPVSDHKWIVIAKATDDEADDSVRRITEEWNRYQENSVRQVLPGFRFRKIRTWRSSDQAQDIQKWFFASTRTNDSPNRDNPHVLIVEDEEDVAMALGVRLQAAGFNVLQASDGEAGLKSAMKNKPDAILLDVRMPKMNGIEVLKSLKADPQMVDTPVIMLSASVRDQQTALDQGARFFIQKPYEPTTVVAGLNKVIS